MYKYHLQKLQHGLDQDILFLFFRTILKLPTINDNAFSVQCFFCTLNNLIRKSLNMFFSLFSKYFFLE